MKRNLSFAGGTKPVIALILFVLLFAWMNSCKKKDMSTTDDKKQALTKEIPDWVREKFSKTPTQMIFPGDGTDVHAIIVDRNGVEITQERINARLLSIPCDYLDPAFIDNNFQLKGEAMTFGCSISNDGFRIVAGILLRTGFTPLTTNGTDFSHISFRIKNSGGTVIYTAPDINVAAGDIVSQGPFISNPDLTVYSIKYTSPLIPGFTSLSGLVFEYKPYIYTDCPDASITMPSPLWLKRSTPADYTNSCLRLDVVEFVGDPGSPGTAYFNGSNAGPCYPIGITPPDQHGIEWYKPGTGTYGTASAPTALQFPNFCLPSPALVDLPCTLGTSAVTFPTTGMIKVRYYNKKQSSTNPCTSTNICNGQASEYFDLNLY